MNEKISQYLTENKEKFPQNVLVDSLRQTGYVESDIQEGIKQVYGELKAVLPEAPQKMNFHFWDFHSEFWDFRKKREYQSRSEKLKDFFFGLIAPAVVSLFLGIIMSFADYGMFQGVAIAINGIEFIVYIFLLVYFFSRRRSIFWGLLGAVVILPAVAIVAVIIILSSIGLN